MKLKKIASLMLAGVMAVSMLAGCSGNNTDDGASSGDTTPSSSYTETVLKATNAATQTKLSTSSSDKLDKAIAWAAQNGHGNGNFSAVLNNLEANDDHVTLAKEYMKGAKLDSYSKDTNWSFDPNQMALTSDPQTFWTMYYVGRNVSDEFITNEVAEKLDNWAKVMANKGEVVKGNTYDYTVSVSKADCAGADLTAKSDDYVIIGVAITVDKTEVTY